MAGATGWVATVRVAGVVLLPGLPGPVWPAFLIDLTGAKSNDVKYSVTCRGKRGCKGNHIIGVLCFDGFNMH